MIAIPETNPQSLSAHDREELTNLVNTVALSENSLTLYAIAPESSPDHPVTEAFAAQLKQELEEPLQFRTFFYSDQSLFNFLATLDSQMPPAEGRRIIFAFGLEQLPKPRLKQELEQLNLAREKIFEQNLVLVFWLNRERFLDEFRDRAPDFWDWRGNVALFEQRHPLLYPYLEWLIAEHSYLRMSGVMQVNRQVDIFLDQIYMSLQAERRQQITMTSKHQQVSIGKVASPRQIDQGGKGDLDLDLDFAPEPMLEVERSVPEEEASSTKTVVEPVDLADVVRGTQACSVILGAPGAGKTTLLKYLALHFARALRDKQDTVQSGTEQETLGQPRWPIYLKIADYAERLENHPELSVLDYLKLFYRSWEDYFEGSDASALVNLLLEKMQQGNGLILLDGLDEVFDQDSRRQIVASINQFAEEFGHNKLIVTSRIAGYQEVKLSDRFAEFTITDMTDDQVSDFLHRWCRAVEQAQKPEATIEQQERAGTQQAEQLLSDIQRNEGVKRLTANPLLLTILALIHRNGERLPERRVKLYELAVQTLTADWQLSKKLPNAQKVLLPEGEVVGLLAPLAYWMHEEKPSGQVTHAEVIEQLAPKLAELRGEVPDSPEVLAAVEEFLRRVRETTGLFVERAPDVYGFMHLTFEEYFAARDMADKDQSEILATIQKHWGEPRWTEPILLALGYYGSYSPGQMNRLVEKLFESLDAYQPILGKDEIKLTKGDSQQTKLQWRSSEQPKTSEFALQDLLLAGQVMAQVAEIKANRRKKLIDQLLITGLALADDPDDAEESVVKQILQLLRQIEQFHQQGEVVAALQKVVQDAVLPKEMRLKAQTAKLYVLCGEAGVSLVDCAAELAESMDPDLFLALRNIVNDLGGEMSSALEVVRHQPEFSAKQHLLTFLAAMTYVREKHYDKAIKLFEELSNLGDALLSPYIAWSTASCYRKKKDYDKANDFYKACEQLIDCFNPNSFLTYWEDRGLCQQLHEKYEQALDCFQQMLAIARDLRKPKEEALCFYHFGRTYQAWGKYEEAIGYYEQSRDLYQQLDKEADVASQWYRIADCYRDWGKYKQALAAAQQGLTIRQKLDDQSGIVSTYFQLGRIYQAWGKYEEAIGYYEQSRDHYQQLEKESNVANQWDWIADCYRDWGKYEQALAPAQQGLAIRQKLNDQSSIANAYFRLGRIYQAWGKYEEAIGYHEQSRHLYQQLEKGSNVANQWKWIADCYREWGKYEQALAAAQQGLAIRQKLDDQPSIANAYFRLGWIYQAWGKYEEAIGYYEQSRNLYQQLEKESNVAIQRLLIAACYREWSKYEQALAAVQQSLTLHQKLNDQPSIALACCYLGQVYQSWGKYEEAIGYHEQSRDLYQQLEKESDVANQWYWIADCYREWGKYEEALAAAQQGLAICQKLDDQSSIANAYFRLGRIYQAWGKYEEAIGYYEQSRNIYQQLEKESSVANQWYWIADCYREWGKYEQALAAAQQGLAIRQKLDDQSSIANAYFRLGRIYQAWGKYEEAIGYYEQSRNIYQQLEKESSVANQWYWIADCYREWGKYEQALAAAQQRLAIRQKLDDQIGIASVYAQLGRIYQAWGKYEEAIGHYEQSRDRYQQLEKESNVANQWDWIADCYREWDKYEPALAAAQQTLAIRQKLDDQIGIANVYFRLGQIYQTWGKYKEAIGYHEQSRDLYQQLEKESNVANQWDWIADCYRDWGKYEQALAPAQQGLAIRQKLNDQSSIANAYFRLGRIYQAWGKYEEAIGYYEQSRDIYQQLEKEANVANQWSWIASCYCDWGKYEPAVTAAQQRLAIRQKLNDQSSIANAYVSLGRIYQAWGKYEEAIGYYEQSRSLDQQMKKASDVASMWSWIALCYRDLNDYSTAIEFLQKSFEQHQAIGKFESAARQLRQLTYTQVLQAKKSSSTEAIDLLQQADHNLQQAIQMNIAGDYRVNLAYDHVDQALLIAGHLKQLPPDDNSIPERICQFEQATAEGFARFAELGQTVSSAEEAIDIARAYLEIEPLNNLDKAEDLARQSLATFQTFNRRKLKAAANQLLGEIYLARFRQQEAGADVTAIEFLTTSLSLYQELDIACKSMEVEQLLSTAQL